MTSPAFDPVEQPPHRPAIATLRGVASLLGRFVVVAALGGVGVAGWMGAERYDLDVPFLSNSSSLATSLPELGDGLPELRLQSPEPWRQFTVTHREGDSVEISSFDLDGWRVAVPSTDESPRDAIEIQGDQGFVRLAGTEEWVEQDSVATRNIARGLMAGIGPFLVTDLVPPNVLGFTTLELEGTSRGERVYEVSVDAPTLRSEHPLAYERWVSTTRIVNESSDVYRIRVREDGYVVRIDGPGRSVQWDPLPAGVQFVSPLAAVAPLATVPLTVGGDLGAPSGVEPGPEPASVPAAPAGDAPVEPVADPVVDSTPVED